MKQINLSLLVHAQSGFTYTNHEDIQNIQKHIEPASSLQLTVSGYGKPLFKTGHTYPKSFNDGHFNPEIINDYLVSKGINPDVPISLDIVLLGGDFTMCLSTVFKLIIKWESATPFLNRTTVRLPYDAVFESDKDSDKIYLLSDLVKDEIKPTLVMKYHLLKGQTHINQDSIDFKFRERPWGMFKDSKCIVPIDHEY